MMDFEYKMTQAFFPTHSESYQNMIFVCRLESGSKKPAKMFCTAKLRQKNTNLMKSANF